MSAPEFSRIERADTIGEGERTIRIEADEAERAALARRFELKSVDSLEAEFRLRRDAAGITAHGHVRGAVVQACVVTDEPVPVAIDEPVALRFVTDDIAGEGEIELDEDALDTMLYDGAAVDLGEAAAETMALALDPYPRGPGAAAALRAAGVVSEDEVTPLNAFAGLKAKLEGN
ncbi:MAG: hypothetical protein JWL96_2542 [Sphingomonas bacterium]|uniref:YceD family protein n=1 Tax=Sphingomonas bacterium TaxID=1895847 RepID=UPI00261E4832|nr:DUF177 domain-containing protein [Sphingomonas bacterium]MDB5710472.1 hypothetical protein [Sphingomonas bacterium]